MIRSLSMLSDAHPVRATSIAAGPTHTDSSKATPTPRRSPKGAQVSYTDGYSDRFVTLSLSTRTLTIHRFVLGPSLTIPLDSILSLRPASSVFHGGVDPWGLSITGIGWGRDMRRLLWSKERRRAVEESWVVQWGWGWGVRAGFSTVEPAGFGEVCGDAGLMVQDREMKGRERGSAVLEEG